MVPVDVCINLMCVLAWKAATSPSSDTREPPVYNCTSGGVNPLTWGRVETEGLPILLRNPYEGVFWYPGGSYKENYYVNRFFQVSVDCRQTVTQKKIVQGIHKSNCMLPRSCIIDTCVLFVL